MEQVCAYDALGYYLVVHSLSVYYGTKIFVPIPRWISNSLSLGFMDS